jgi:hypothetical protein
MYKLQRVFALAGIFAVTMASPKADVPGISYKYLRYEYMCSKGIKEKDLQKKETPDESAVPVFSFPTLSETGRQLQVFDILQKLEKNYFANNSASKEQSAALKILYKDLEVHRGDGARPDVNLASLTDRTASAAGSAVHRMVFTNPLASSDLKKFKARQSFIKNLVEDEALFNKAEALCAAIASNEDRLLSNWQEADDVSGKVLDGLFFQNSFLKGLNMNPTVMETKIRLGNLATATYLFGFELFVWTVTAYEYMKHNNWSTIYVELPDGGYKYEKKPQINYVQAMGTVLKKACLAVNPFTYFSKAAKRIKQMEEQGYYSHHIEEAKKELYIKRPLFALFWTGMKAFGVKKVMDSALQTRDAINFLQDKLVGLGNLVRMVESLEKLNAEHPVVSKGLVSWKHAADILHRTEKDDFTTLITMLQTDTFKGEASFFSRSGRVLTATKLVEKERDKFAGAIELLGELDVCVSAAKLYKEFEHRRVKFCFADIQKKNKPCIKLQDFWNPFVDYNTVVTNDIELGGSRPEQHVILTGSNTGGKSTVGLKGSLISTYLAHTLGLAPASACELSVFSDFSSYLHVVDDVASGESAFQAEINRANSLIKVVKGLSKDRFAFIVIDELFKGTSPEKGAPGASKVVQYLAGFENVVFIIATHFKELTQLEEEKSSIVNMKMEIFEDENGNLIKPYKLEKGISTHNVANNLMEAGLDIDSLSFA